MSCNYPLISVIVPIYNVEQFLPDCMEALGKQTYCNFEVLLIDDGSTDGSGTRADEYACNDFRFRVFHKENGGVSSARNLGLSQMNGEYFMFCDPDDFFHPDMIQRYYDAIDGTEADLVIGSYTGVPEECSYAEHCFEQINDSLIPQRLDNNTLLNDLISGKSSYGIGISSCCMKLYKASAYEDIRFIEGLIFEDEYFGTQIFSRDCDVVFINEALYFYRQRSGSIMDTYRHERELSEQRVKVYIDRADYLLGLPGISQTHIVHAVDRALSMVKKAYLMGQNQKTRDAFYSLFLNKYHDYSAKDMFSGKKHLMNSFFVSFPGLYRLLLFKKHGREKV